MMTDAEVSEQIERADAFREQLRELIAATAADIEPSSKCADASRDGLQRIAKTLDAVPFMTFANLSNLNAAMKGAFMQVIGLHLYAVGGGPTLDYESATAFFEQFTPMIERVRQRRIN